MSKDYEYFLMNKSSYNKEGFTIYPDFKDSLRNDVKVLCVGAGGLGCEILKNLALMGFGQIDIVDMDTIALSNLNRQFLFRECDIGKYKSEVAAQFVKNRVKNLNINYYTKTVQQLLQDDNCFYSKYNVIIGGLDNEQARLFLNEVVLNLRKQGSNIIYLDGGTGKRTGTAIIIDSLNRQCYNCLHQNNLEVQQATDQCTLANRPRTEKHCVEWIKHLEIDRKPVLQEIFGEDFKNFDEDDENHVQFIHQAAKIRAKQFGINSDFTKFDTIGWFKNPIPAIGTTNAIIAAILCNEAFKHITYCRIEQQDGIVRFCGDETPYMSNIREEQHELCEICQK